MRYWEAAVTSSDAVEEVEVAVEHAEEPAGPEAVVPGLGNVTATFATLGCSNSNELQIALTGLSLTTAQPAVVLVQPRQADNQNFDFPDQFVVQVITTAQDRVVVRVKRIDDPNAGWGQNLRLDLFIVDRVVNP
jgi:hypothetical protein